MEKNQEPESPKPLEKKSEVGDAKKLAGSPALINSILAIMNAKRKDACKKI